MGQLGNGKNVQNYVLCHGSWFTGAQISITPPGNSLFPTLCMTKVKLKILGIIRPSHSNLIGKITQK
jgi:hypothetical protein